MRRAALAAALAVALFGTAAPAQAAVPHVNHVFMVVLENENAGATFGPKTEIPYLANTLTSKGAYLPNYYATGHLSLDNYISMVSGQAPNIETQADCPFYSDLIPGLPTSGGQFVGQGCVYPPGTQNIATQLEGVGYSWRGYMQDMAASVPSEPSTCRHPRLNTPDGTQTATATDQYAARHNPFVYFHSIIDFPTCQANDVDLNQLAPDLASASTTPNYAFITPDLCNDGHDEPCPDGQPGGMVQANRFLQALVPQILASPAYKDRGLLIITFDEAEAEPGEQADASACCGEKPGPNTINPGGPAPGPGGGRIGAVMLSSCIQAGTVSKDPYNHYSLLRSIEDNFRLPHLGFAGQAGLKPLDEQVLNNHGCPVPQKKCKRKKRHKKHHPHAGAAKKHKHKKCKRKRAKKKRPRAAALP
jgi:hypothetical protein